MCCFSIKQDYRVSTDICSCAETLFAQDILILSELPSKVRAL